MGADEKTQKQQDRGQREKDFIHKKRFQLSELLFDTRNFTSYEIKQCTCPMSYMTEQVLIL